MTTVSLSHAAALVGLCAAGFHAWVFSSHRSARSHLWMAVTALGMAGVSLGGAQFAEPHSLEAMVRGHRLQLVGSALLLAGFVHLTACHLRLRIPWVERAVDAVAVGVAGVTLLTPQLLFQDGATPVLLPARAGHFQIFSSFGQVAVGALVACGMVMVGLYLHGWRSGNRAATPLVPVVAVWLAAGVNDSAVGLGLYSAPLLLAEGYLVLVLGLSAMLTRRLAQAGGEVERMTARLQEMAEARAAQLRERDLQLARGEQLASLGTLAAGVAHEINNPLAYVNSNLHQLETLWGKEDDPDEVVEIMADCYEGLDRVRAIAANLVRMAQRGDAAVEEVDLAQVVRSILPMLQQQARNRVELVGEIEPVPPVYGNAHLLGQVVLNLTLNAIQSIPAGDPEKHRVEVATGFHGGLVRLSVQDTGTGIPKDLMRQIFEPFFTTKRKGEGTGLGLTVTRQIVTRHRGEIRVASGSQGTTITVLIPAVGEELPSGAAREGIGPV